MEFVYFFEYIASFFFELSLFYLFFLGLRRSKSKVVLFIFSLVFSFFQLIIFGHFLYFATIPNYFSANFIINDLNYSRILLMDNIHWFHYVILLFLTLFYYFSLTFLCKLTLKLSKAFVIVLLSVFLFTALILHNNVRRHPGNFGAVSNTLFTMYYVLQNKVVNKKFEFSTGSIKREIKIKEKEITKQDFNILLIVSESVRQKNLHYYGYNRENTPFMDSLSKTDNLVLFNNHYSISNNTRYCVHALLSGGITPISNPNSVFIYDYLKKWTNMETYFFSSQSYHGSAHYYNSNLDKFVEFGNTPLSRYNDNGFDDHSLIEIVNEELGKTKPNSKFFSMIQFNNSHSPYQPHPEFNKFTPATTKTLNAYDNAIYEQDYLIKQIFDNLERTNLLESTIVILTSDHGECFMERGHSGHLSCLYNEETLVPFWFYLPPSFNDTLKNKLIQNSSLVTSHIDIFPTILDICGTFDTTMVTNRIEGSSLLQNVPAERTVSLFSQGMNNDKAIIYNNLKLIVVKNEPNKLFDLKSDRNEQIDIWGKQDKDVAAKYKLLFEESANK